MALHEAVIARLAEVVTEPAFARIDGAAELAALVQGGQGPNVTPAAYVLPLGLRDLGATVAAGIYRQALAETIAVVIVVRVAGDRLGERGLPVVETLRDQVIRALAGWAPDEEGVGVFELSRGALVSLLAGTIVYQLDFTLRTQLRIETP